MQTFLFSVLLAASFGQKIEVRFYPNAACDESDNVFARGVLARDANSTEFRGTVHPWHYMYNWSARFNSAAFLNRESPERGYGQRYQLSLNATDATKTYFPGEFGRCEFGPSDRLEGSLSYRLTLLDAPWFDVPGCRQDSDCEDNISCTDTHCNTHTGYCEIRPNDDYCAFNKKRYRPCVPKTCFGGPFHSVDCAVNADCPAGICSASQCNGGKHDGKPCVASYIHGSKFYGELGLRKCISEGGGVCQPGGNGGCWDD